MNLWVHVIALALADMANPDERESAETFLWGPWFEWLCCEVGLDPERLRSGMYTRRSAFGARLFMAGSKRT